MHHSAGLPDGARRVALAVTVYEPGCHQCPTRTPRELSAHGQPSLQLALSRDAVKDDQLKSPTPAAAHETSRLWLI